MIESWLQELEQTHNIDILFASETGSRAWGGATAHSDYDVRFIFKHRDVRTYLSLDKAKETIDYSVRYDTQGWDLFKAFILLEKSNPSLLEWSFSPIVYRDHGQFSNQLRTLVKESYSLFSLYQHYIHVMARNLQEIRDQDFTEKRQKQLIQAIRAFLLSKAIFLTQKLPVDALYSSFIDIAPDENRLVSFYNELMNAKQRGDLVHLDSVKEVILLMGNERATLDKRSADLPRGKNITLKLEQWIWELLSI